MVRPRGRRMGRGMGRGFGGPPSNCKCPACGHTQVKVRGVPCVQVKCEKCGTMMVGGN